MYNRQTKDNKKWCDLANLTNVYNSDTIHHYVVDNKSQTFITNKVKYRDESETWVSIINVIFDTVTNCLSWQQRLCAENALFCIPIPWIKDAPKLLEKLLGQSWRRFVLCRYFRLCFELLKRLILSSLAFSYYSRYCSVRPIATHLLLVCQSRNGLKCFNCHTASRSWSFIKFQSSVFALFSHDVTHFSAFHV